MAAARQTGLATGTAVSPAKIPAPVPYWLWARVVGKVALIAAIACGALELFWALAGYTPSVRDDASLWALVRRQASGQHRTAVLVGTSRSHAGLDPQVLGRVVPGLRWLQLSINGTSPLPVLEDLANDESFSGLVICELYPLYLVAPPGLFGERAGQWVQAYHRQSWGDSVETELRAAVQSRFRFARDEANLIDFVRRVSSSGLAAGATPDLMRTDRFTRIDFSRAPIGAMADQWVKVRIEDKHSLEGKETRESFSRIAMWAAQIERRGGKVVFFHMITSGKVYAIESRLYPRDQYWDAFARSQRSLSIHFADYPSLRDFVCPEGSHLDYRDVPRFSAAFAEVLKGTNVFQTFGAPTK